MVATHGAIIFVDDIDAYKFNLSAKETAFGKLYCALVLIESFHQYIKVRHHAVVQKCCKKTSAIMFLIVVLGSGAYSDF